MPGKAFFVGALVLLCLLAISSWPKALAQYRSGSSYPYQRQSSGRLPTSARHVGGFIGNPYRNDRVAPTGLPVGRNLQAYYGGARRSGGGNPLAHRPVYKPFSNIAPNPPLITSRDAARIEISRGLWLW